MSGGKEFAIWINFSRKVTFSSALLGHLSLAHGVGGKIWVIWC